MPYGYEKDLENPRRWVVDPEAADVVKRIFDLCMKGRGPMQIANQPKADKVLTPSAYRALQGIKTPNKKPEDPCDWHSSTVVAILERREYTGCTVNFKTYTNSIWDKKQRDNPLEKQAIFPNTHEAIIEEAVFEKVQQVRQQRGGAVPAAGRRCLCAAAAAVRRHGAGGHVDGQPGGLPYQSQACVAAVGSLAGAADGGAVHAGI